MKKLMSVLLAVAVIGFVGCNKLKKEKDSVKIQSFGMSKLDHADRVRIYEKPSEYRNYYGLEGQFIGEVNPGSGKYEVMLNDGRQVEFDGRDIFEIGEDVPEKFDPSLEHPGDVSAENQTENLEYLDDENL